ncbi:DUF1311 domain-containing protein [Paracoccus liaowanqingii]|uniref:DUF1311 domain-containing protein n=1 Tax=Paracoccus liaowanqingii TaxID=2560053 RepID=A0A4Z1CGD5_9RHOB|nr:lysozyme inhibitor LprI family protein [Paracoccus liaowanqingii]TGN60947.1 DUF1311 domain-containing protein [Paracoccus liaowanqingii]
MRTIALALLLAGPAAAQEGPPSFDAGPLIACLEGEAPHDGCIGLASAACMAGPDGQTTVGMGFCLDAERQIWDDRLNTAYGALMERAEATDAEMTGLGSSAPPQAPALREMQRDWIAYRDAACTYEAVRWGGGTGAGPAATQCALTLTARQTLWLDGYLVEGR